jgi:hypothetical protein
VHPSHRQLVDASSELGVGPAHLLMGNDQCFALGMRGRNGIERLPIVVPISG